MLIKQTLISIVCLIASTSANYTAIISNITTTPVDIEVDRFPFIIKIEFIATVTKSEEMKDTKDTKDTEQSKQTQTTTSPAYFDSIVEVCPPKPYTDHCFVFPAGKFNRSSGVYYATAKISTDNAWWRKQGGNDIIPGHYTTDLAICDGNCVKWLVKPTILAEMHGYFNVVPMTKPGNSNM